MPSVHNSTAIPSSPISNNAAPQNRMPQPVRPKPKAIAVSSPQAPFYGHESTSRLCARFITHLFTCPEYQPSPTHSQVSLPHFIAYALHRTRLHPSVTFAALTLLQRLKVRFPSARGSNGHRLFISAFMIASRVMCDDTYSNKSWRIVAQGMFSLREMNQMEREMCSYLDWQLTIDIPGLSKFESMVKHEFQRDGNSPTYSLQYVSQRDLKVSQSVPQTSIHPPYATTAPAVPIEPRPSSSSSPPPSNINIIPSPSPSPSTPEIPDQSDSTSSIPSSDSLPSSPDCEVFDDSIPNLSLWDGPVRPSKIHPLKGKTFAFAVPSVW